MSHEYCSMNYSLGKAALYLLDTYFVFQSRTVFKLAKEMFLDFSVCLSLLDLKWIDPHPDHASECFFKVLLLS